MCACVCEGGGKFETVAVWANPLEQSENNASFKHCLKCFWFLYLAFKNRIHRSVVHAKKLHH